VHCYRLQSEGVRPFTAMIGGKRDVVFVLRLWEFRCPRRALFQPHELNVWTLTVVCSLCRLSCMVAGSTLLAGIPICHELGCMCFMSVHCS
jgi:hypothetical protein